VLHGVGELLLRSLRATDVGGRFGGDEMLVVLPQIPAKGALVMAERWRAGVEQAAFRAPDGRSIRATLSIGIAEHAKAMAHSDELISAADKALYAAKQRGRNCVELFGGGAG
jgi:diguanylate cyclase (GGDEF)-like protein